MEAAANPYQTPEGNLQQADETQAEVKIFSPSGRIGRLRYLAYGTAMALISHLATAILMLSLEAGSAQEPAMLLIGINGIVGIVTLIFGVIWMIKRLHDVDKTGWLALLIIVPLVNLIFVLYLLFAPGTPTGNRFGPAPVPNSTGVKILAALFPVAMVLGFFVGFMGGVQ